MGGFTTLKLFIKYTNQIYYFISVEKKQFRLWSTLMFEIIPNSFFFQNQYRHLLALSGKNTALFMHKFMTMTYKIENEIFNHYIALSILLEDSNVESTKYALCIAKMSI